MRSLKEQIIKADRSLLLSEAKIHPSQSIVAEVASNMGWLKVWDTALDHGPPGTIAVLSVLKLLSKTVFADRKCNMECCDFVIPPNIACYEHFLSLHTDLNIDIDSLLSQIYSCSEELFQTGLKSNSVNLCELNICFVHCFCYFSHVHILSLLCVHVFLSLPFLGHLLRNFEL